MLRYHCLPLRFSASRLKDDLASITPEEWTPHFNTRYYEGEWSGVALRSASGSAMQLYPGSEAQQSTDTPVLARCPYFREVLGAFTCPVSSARLLRLKAGSRIKEHRDYNLAAYEDGELRIHIPVQTNPKVEFYLDGHRLPLLEGECWYMNLNLPHRVYNGGAADRVHLVIDCVVNDWVRTVLPEG